jgi:hypothetical protein
LGAGSRKQQNGEQGDFHRHDSEQVRCQPSIFGCGNRYLWTL